MRIGLYGLPTAGKANVLDKVHGLEVFSGSSLLEKIAPEFHELPEAEKSAVRTRLALQLKEQDTFIMDGHYSFGDEVVFTEADGQLYDVFLYLYVDPEVLCARMKDSDKNHKYLKYDIASWQRFEIEALRKYCHENNKDFYVVDNPTEGFFSNADMILEFIDSILQGYSCVKYARDIVDSIQKEPKFFLVDGDKTLIHEDSSALLGYSTHLFDGNFYSGFQAWRHDREISEYLQNIGYSGKLIDDLDITFNNNVRGRIGWHTIILSSGRLEIWKQIAVKQAASVCCGSQMCADTKYFFAKFLQEKGSKVVAFGDSMNDYYMLKQADTAYLVLKKDGTVSSSLAGRELEGFICIN